MTPSIWRPADFPSQSWDKLATVVSAYLKRSESFTPALLIDRSAILASLKRWTTFLPTVSPYYAVKANVDPLILRELFQAGANADVASAFEIDACHAVGISGDRMIVSNPRKDLETIRRLHQLRVFATVVDSEDEVDKLAAEGIPSPSYHPVLFVRIKVPTKGVTQDLSSKFGVRVLPRGADPLSRTQLAPDVTAVRSIFQLARQHGFRNFGLSTHVGTQCSDSTVYDSALDVLAKVAKSLIVDGFDIQFIDIGGGFADSQTLTKSNTTAESLLSGIAATVDRWSGPPVRFLAEPGRFFVADAGVLLSQVIYDRHTDATGRRVQIDDGIYRTLSGRIHDEKSFQFVALRARPQPFLPMVANMVVWGCSCDSFDQVAESVPLPADLTVGDYLLADTLGAYSTSFGSNTNGFQPAPPVLWWEESGQFQFAISPMADQNNLLLNHIRVWSQSLNGVMR